MGKIIDAFFCALEFMTTTEKWLLKMKMIFSEMILRVRNILLIFRLLISTASLADILLLMYNVVEYLFKYKF